MHGIKGLSLQHFVAHLIAHYTDPRPTALTSQAKYVQMDLKQQQNISSLYRVPHYDECVQDVVVFKRTSVTDGSVLTEAWKVIA